VPHISAEFALKKYWIS